MIIKCTQLCIQKFGQLSLGKEHNRYQSWDFQLESYSPKNGRKDTFLGVEKTYIF